MNPVHPYLNPAENPANALNRLLQLLPASMHDFGFNEAQLSEAICFQARRTHQLICASQTALQALLPAPDQPGEPRHSNLFHVNILLQTEADITRAMGEVYAVMVEDYFTRNPHLPRYPHLMPAAPAPAMPATPWPFATQAFAPPPCAPHASATHTYTPAPAQSAPASTHDPHTHPSAQDTAQLLAEYDKHYYFPLGRLLQQLPGDITNQPHLSPEQGQMCLAVSGFAAQAVVTIQDGLGALETLLGQTIDSAGSAVPEIKKLVDYLQAECEFLQTCEGDYHDAANHILRVV
jgi:hypothetical protein